MTRMGITLEAQGIAQTRGQEILAPTLFRDVSFRWQAPALHVIMGSSGVGKSSFLKSIGGVWKPIRGRLLLDDRPLWAAHGFMQDRELLSRIGFAFQNNALFSSLRVAENLMLPHRQRFADVTENKRRDIAQEWLEKVELGHTASLYPQELSGGMQKRLAIARTLILQPDFIFLDDPTAGLDPITSKIIAELVASLLKGSPALVVIVTNDPDRARQWNGQVHFLNEEGLCSREHAAYARLQEAYL